MNNQNYHSILTPLSLGVTRADGEDYHVMIQHIFTEGVDGILGTTGIFHLYIDNFGIDKSDFEDLLSGETEDYYLPDDKNPDYLGRILFDENGNWIYDGAQLSVDEQEQIGEYISTFQEGDIGY